MTKYYDEPILCVNCKMGKNGDASCAAGRVHSNGNYACFKGRPLQHGEPAKKPSKYGNVRCEYDNLQFDSKFEMEHYKELKLLEKLGEITDLKCHVKFSFIHNGINLGYYESDFCFMRDGKYVVEDTKGVKTAMYNLKKKMMKAFWDITIVEVYKK